MHECPGEDDAGAVYLCGDVEHAMIQHGLKKTAAARQLDASCGNLIHQESRVSSSLVRLKTTSRGGGRAGSLVQQTPKITTYLLSIHTHLGISDEGG